MKKSIKSLVCKAMAIGVVFASFQTLVHAEEITDLSNAEIQDEMIIELDAEVTVDEADAAIIERPYNNIGCYREERWQYIEAGQADCFMRDDAYCGDWAENNYYRSNAHHSGNRGNRRNDSNRGRYYNSNRENYHARNWQQCDVPMNDCPRY